MSKKINFSSRLRRGLNGLKEGREVWFRHPRLTWLLVSNYGDLYSQGRMVWNARHKVFYQKKDGYVRTRKCNGYLWCFDTTLVHHLVLETFVGPMPPGQECRHLDGVRDNPRLDNLCWGTRQENVGDAIRHGTFKSPPGNHTTEHCRKAALKRWRG